MHNKLWRSPKGTQIEASFKLHKSLNYVKCFINGRNKYKFDDTTYMSKQEMRARAQSNRVLYPHILVVADFDTISLLGEKKAKKNK